MYKRQKFSDKKLIEMIGSSLTQLRKEAGISYLGGVKFSAKMKYSYNKGTATYCIYLAPSTLSGYNVCPFSQWCKDFCLNRSGQNKILIISEGEESKINKSRIKKTKLFFENKELFMKILILEIIKEKQKAKKNKMNFAIRLNGTSDLNPVLFSYKGIGLLDMFPNIQFYDYTKVPSRIKLLEQYDNYDLTFSYDGHNWNTCENFLNAGGKVSVVFDCKLPDNYKGYEVINANEYDMRFLDKGGTIMGLNYHKISSDYTGGLEFQKKKELTKFIVKQNDL